jgi:hypothetical protein
MDLPDPGYLFNLSIIAVTFVGFSAIVVILRQSLGNPFQPLDSIASRLFMIWGFSIAFAAMLPVLLSQFKMPAEAIWSISSVIAGLATGAINIVYPIMRPRIVGSRNSLHIWLHVGFGLLIALALLINALRPFAQQTAGIYALALTLYMAEASFAFVQHFGLMLNEARKAAGKL